MTSEQIITLIIAILGAITGLIGTAIGVMTFRRQIADERLNLRVGASCALAATANGISSSFLTISVTNMSKFPVTIRETGLLVDNERQCSIHRDVTLSNGGRLPIRMEPKTAISIYYPVDFALTSNNDTATFAYAKTDCGEIVQSAPGIVPKVIAELRRANTTV